MPGKSHKGRGSHLSRSKRRKGGKGFSAPAAQPPAVAQEHEPAPQADMYAPPAKTPTRRATVTAAQRTNIAAELRNIGIVGGIMLVILVAAALIFS